MRCYILILLSAMSMSCAETTLTHKKGIVAVSRSEYKDRLYGFWLAQCIANWTGLVTEMDKIGNIGEIRTGDFYTRDDWGKPDQPSIWAEGVPSDLSKNIDFVFRDTSEIWGADDDTDIEYMYQELMNVNGVSLLTPEMIRDGWIKHIKEEEENYLWVSNQRAFDLMLSGLLPPETSDPKNNEHFDMIDAQLTTEIFGLFAPGRPDVALQLAELPILTTARGEAKEIAQFYVVMYSLAYNVDKAHIGSEIRRIADEARKYLSEDNYPASMYDYVLHLYDSGAKWEVVRDSLYHRYQVRGEDGYDITARNLYCNGCFAAGINFAASLVSLFYGNGDLMETIKIGTLAGWDSDNPTATWGGMLGYVLGKEGVERVFNRQFSNRFNIHRTRKGFPGDGIDSFEEMASKGLMVTERVLQDFSIELRFHD